ncbi:PUA-like domain-containing protein [Ilyonectria destructans]|nr:PUA-like domain-containing protein [Ilyonectria destructans]
MPPRKRNAPASDTAVAEPVPKRRSLRSATRSQAQTVKEEDVKPQEPKPTKSEKKPAKKPTKTKPDPKDASDKTPKTEKVDKTEKDQADKPDKPATESRVSETPDIDSIPTRNPDAPKHDGEWYWLMKAEPETRMENGIDVRFSIDDLRAKEKPEGWDGIRAYPARNNMRNMNAGDKAFFYHSNCKEPAIVGIMEIVKEFSEDRTARQPGTPYYDPSSTKDKPKWDLVHVEFRKKFAVKIGLKELRELGKPGGPLENMQMLKQSRLSVSKVSGPEFKALCELADKKAKDAGLEHEE